MFPHRAHSAHQRPSPLALLPCPFYFCTTVPINSIAHQLKIVKILKQRCCLLYITRLHYNSDILHIQQPSLYEQWGHKYTSSHHLSAAIRSVDWHWHGAFSPHFVPQLIKSSCFCLFVCLFFVFSIHSMKFKQCQFNRAHIGSVMCDDRMWHSTCSFSSIGESIQIIYSIQKKQHCTTKYQITYSPSITSESSCDAKCTLSDGPLTCKCCSDTRQDLL